MNSFASPGVVARLDSLMPELIEADGVVLDLRENTGGNDRWAADLLARFTDAPQVGAGWRTRVHDAYYRALGSFGRQRLEQALPGEEELIERATRHWEGNAWRYEEPDTLHSAFSGERVRAPVAVLVDRTTASAAENLLTRLPDDARFVVVGAPTAASTGQPVVFALPGGGTGQVVTRAVLLPDGTPLVKAGIRPDLRVEPTLEQVRAGEDPVLERALTWLGEAARR